MDNRNMYQQTQAQNGYYPYTPYIAATAPMMRPEIPAYMMPQTAVPAGLKGRPVSSFEEARVAQIDLDGSISIFPDLGNKKIYTKRINADGTAALQTYSLDMQPVEAVPEYATKEEIAELKQTLESIISKLQSATAAQPAQKTALNF